VGGGSGPRGGPCGGVGKGGDAPGHHGGERPHRRGGPRRRRRRRRRPHRRSAQGPPGTTAGGILFPAAKETVGVEMGDWRHPMKRGGEGLPGWEKQGRGWLQGNREGGSSASREAPAPTALVVAVAAVGAAAAAAAPATAVGRTGGPQCPTSPGGHLLLGLNSNLRTIGTFGPRPGGCFSSGPPGWSFPGPCRRRTLESWGGGPRGDDWRAMQHATLGPNPCGDRWAGPPVGAPVAAPVAAVPPAAEARRVPARPPPPRRNQVETSLVRSGVSF